MHFSNNLVGFVLDRLGHDVMLITDGNEHITVAADVVVSPRFFTWILGFDGMAHILGPQRVIDRMVTQTETIISAYKTQK